MNLRKKEADIGPNHDEVAMGEVDEPHHTQDNREVRAPSARACPRAGRPTRLYSMQRRCRARCAVLSDQGAGTGNKSSPVFADFGQTITPGFPPCHCIATIGSLDV